MTVRKGWPPFEVWHRQRVLKDFTPEEKLTKDIAEVIDSIRTALISFSVQLNEAAKAMNEAFSSLNKPPNNKE